MMSALFCHFLSQLILKTQSNRLYTHILFPFTLPRTHRISGLKSQVLKPTFFYLKMMVKSGLDFFYFEILLVPSELLLPSTKKSAQKLAETAWQVCR